MTRKWIVYKHTNMVNNKVYIGITSQDPIVRWQGGNGYRDNYHFHRAIKKYGWKSFSHEIISKNLSKKEACSFEIFLISYYKSSDRRYGYNISLGGNVPSKESIEKARQKNIGSKRTEEQKEKMRQNHADFSKGNHPSARKIICVTTMELFDCITDAGDKYNLNKSDIGRCCRGELNYVGIHSDTGEKLIWKYYDSTIDYKALKDNLVYKANNYPDRYTAIVCIFKGGYEKFPSVKHAVEELDIKQAGISNCLSKKSKVCKSKKKNTYVTFMYEKDFLNLNEDEKADLMKFNFNIPTKKITLLNTGEIFESAKKASEITGIHTSTINSNLKGRNKVGGTLKNGDKAIWNYYRE